MTRPTDLGGFDRCVGIAAASPLLLKVCAGLAVPVAAVQDVQDDGDGRELEHEIDHDDRYGVDFYSRGRRDAWTPMDPRQASYSFTIGARCGRPCSPVPSTVW